MTNKSINTDCLLKPFKTSQTYYQQIHQNHKQSIDNRPWRPPALSSGPLCAPKQPQRVPRDPHETLKIHQRGSKRVPRGSKRVPREPKMVPIDPQTNIKWCQRGPRRTLGRSCDIFWSLLGSLLTKKQTKISMFDACASDFGPKSACSMPVHRILVENA